MKIMRRRPEESKEQRFRKIYEDYYASFCIYAKQFIDDRNIREDIVSDVFATLWRKRNEMELRPETVLAFLKTCVRNSCLNYIKHQNYEMDYVESYKARSPAYEIDPDMVYTLEELYDLLYQTLEKLPENYRTVFVKHFFEGKTHVEIARDMGLSVKSIDRYKQKVMEILRHELKDYLPILLIIFHHASS